MGEREGIIDSHKKFIPGPGAYKLTDDELRKSKCEFSFPK